MENPNNKKLDIIQNDIQEIKEKMKEKDSIIFEMKKKISE